MIDYHDRELKNLTPKQLKHLKDYNGEINRFSLHELDETISEIAYFRSFNFPKSYEENYRDYEKYIDNKVKSAKELSRFVKDDIVLKFPVHPSVSKGRCIKLLLDEYPRDKVSSMMHIVFNTDKIPISQAAKKLNVALEITELDGLVSAPMIFAFMIKADKPPRS